MFAAHDAKASTQCLRRPLSTDNVQKKKSAYLKCPIDILGLKINQ